MTWTLRKRITNFKMKNNNSREREMKYESDMISGNDKRIGTKYKKITTQYITNRSRKYDKERYDTCKNMTR